MSEYLGKHYAEGLQVARTVQLGACEPDVVADGAEIECAGQDGRDHQSCDEDGELLPELQAAENIHTASPCWRLTPCSGVCQGAAAHRGFTATQ
jgi:hypothetical protein